MLSATLTLLVVLGGCLAALALREDHVPPARPPVAVHRVGGWIHLNAAAAQAVVPLSPAGAPIDRLWLIWTATDQISATIEPERLLFRRRPRATAGALDVHWELITYDCDLPDDFDERA